MVFGVEFFFFSILIDNICTKAASVNIELATGCWNLGCEKSATHEVALLDFIVVRLSFGTNDQVCSFMVDFYFVQMEEKWVSTGMDRRCS